MNKSYYSLGLMSGTSMDGVDASIIHSDGITKYQEIFNKYFEYNKELYRELTSIRDKITNSKDLKTLQNKLKSIEKEITLFHVKVVKEIIKESSVEIDLIGFHGQTIFHNAEEKISTQLGDGKLLSKLTKKIVVYDFRQNDLKNWGNGAPLTPIFHQVMVSKINDQFKIGYPIQVINIGGISNITSTSDPKDPIRFHKVYANDIGPGNCLIDEWIRKKTKKRYDKDGLIARSGKTNKSILKKALENFNKENLNKYLETPKNNLRYQRSFDTKDFDISFVKDLSLEDGASTLTDFTAAIISQGIKIASGMRHPNLDKWLVCGGGRKNKYLMDSIIKKGPEYFKIDDPHFNKKLYDLKTISLEPIEKYEIDGDFVESQAFAYLAIRSYLKLPISFPSTTCCKEEYGCTGGVIVKNY
mgnify:CR=1 FL=1|tara:strand:+ start:353 stop:1594 length:1242 start_codon:yes stop_codon:yes gene_type:complete